ncbi:MAG: hydantoinase/oxoprolinase family protein [Myxococcales bacterium]|nr:MAG: hydantoinase/oxoprolinase family protein [Myxococcales bacterium]
MSGRGYRIGIDVGGTFTDFVLVRPEGELRLFKVPSTLEDQSRGVMIGISLLAEDEGLDVRALLGDTALIVHGTTTADNTMIEMNGARTGLLTTEGHRDEIDIRRGFKEEIWDPAYPPPVPIARRRHRFGIPERLDFRGNVVTPLDEEAARTAVRRLRRDGIESIAVTLLFSFVNPAHEKRLREIIEEEYPGVRVSLSHEVMPTAPEFERTSTTLVDAYVGPRVERYLRSLQAALTEAGYARELLIMQSNGGIMTAGFVADHAVTALGSGPTGGVMGACAVAARAEIGDFIAIDMGGTSYEVCLVKDGRPGVRSFWNWQHRYLVGLPMVEMHSIGAGGGSIAYVEAGALRVGPHSAKAEPGPICYGRGGTQVTVTDANLVLGYINPEALCGGDFRLSSAGVREAITEQIGGPLGLDPVEAAHGIFRIVNANMANAIRRASSASGLDARDFAMVVYGGNGPVHAGRQAEELGIRRLIVPKTSPAFSALGLLIADCVVDTQRSYIAPAAHADVGRVNELLAEVTKHAESELAKAGIERDKLELRRFLNICYPGQTFDMAVPARISGDSMTAEDLAATFEEFHDLHERTHTFASRDEEPVLRAVRLQAVGETWKPEFARAVRMTTTTADALKGERDAFFDGAFIKTPVYDGEGIGYGHVIEGPAIVEERFTTIVLNPGDRAELDETGNYRIDIVR